MLRTLGACLPASGTADGQTRIPPIPWRAAPCRADPGAFHRARIPTVVLAVQTNGIEPVTPVLLRSVTSALALM